jgi:PhnB protein
MEGQETEGHQMNLAAQLEFRGQCREAFDFYAALLGGEITVMNTFGGNTDHRLPPGSVAGPDDKVRFAEVCFPGGILRGNDVGDDAYSRPQGFSVSLHLDDIDAARRIFDGLAEGGTIATPLSEVDWAKLFGMVVDRFGVPWLILALK